MVILAVVVIVAIALAAAFSLNVMPPETAPVTGTTPTPPTVSAADLLTGLQCSGDNIEGTITNRLNEQVLVEDIRVLFNGNVVRTATLRCDKTVLQPGESTKCLSLEGVVPITGTNQVSVVIGTEYDRETITC